MAATAVLGSGVRALCPSFAEVCSFLERYGATLDLPEMSFTEMEGYLRDTTTGEARRGWRRRGGGGGVSAEENLLHSELDRHRGDGSERSL